MFSPNEAVVAKDEIVRITSEDFYESLVMINTLTRINATHSKLKPDYNKYTLSTKMRFFRFTPAHLNALEKYFFTVKEEMLEPKVRMILKNYYYEMVGEFQVFTSLNITLEKPIEIYSKSKNFIKMVIELNMTEQGCNKTKFVDDKLGELTK